MRGVASGSGGLRFLDRISRERMGWSGRGSAKLCPSCAQLQRIRDHSSTLQRMTPSRACCSRSNTSYTYAKWAIGLLVLDVLEEHRINNPRVHEADAWRALAAAAHHARRPFASVSQAAIAGSSHAGTGQDESGRALTAAAAGC
jgi:hypothetical protein